MSRTNLDRRVVTAAGEVLARRKFVTVADVCIGLGWLTSSHVDRWRQGRVPDLESFLPVHDDKLAQILVILQRWAEVTALRPVETDYVAATRGRRQVRFTSAVDPAAERTRRAKKASRLSAVVVQWNRARKRYQRRGILIEERALEQAEQQCLR